MASKILFKYTSKSRPDNFFRGLDSIVSNLFNKEDYFILCSFDVDCQLYLNKEFTERLDTYKNLSYYFGISHSKIDAINRDIPLAPPFDILVNFSDDQVITQWAFDDLIRNDMPEDTDMVLHYKDINNGNRLMTMSVIGKKYFDRTGLIYNSEYTSLYCDLEAQEVAQILGKYKYIDLVIYEHLHPAYGKAVNDDQYRHTESFYAKDGEVYFRRKANNFGL